MKLKTGQKLYGLKARFSKSSDWFWLGGFNADDDIKIGGKIGEIGVYYTKVSAEKERKAYLKDNKMLEDVDCKIESIGIFVSSIKLDNHFLSSNGLLICKTSPDE